MFSYLSIFAFFLVFWLSGGAHSLERSKTCVLVIQTAALAIARGILDLEKWCFHLTIILRQFPREVPQATVLIERQV